MEWGRFLTAMAAVLLLAGAGACQQGPQGGAGGGQQVIVSGGARIVDNDGGLIRTDAAKRVVMPREGDPTLDWSDPCAANMQSLMGELLFYYTSHNKMPETLDQLQAIPGEKVASINCPKSGKPYVYVAAGLRAPEALSPGVSADGLPLEGNRLLVYDSVPAHRYTQHLTDGNRDWDVTQTVRYGVVMEPLEPNRPVKMYMVPVEQALLDMYLRANK